MAESLRQLTNQHTTTEHPCQPFRNELERQFLEMLQFNINVPSSVYAKYYFDLRTLAEANDLSFPPEPLSKERAQKLEAMSLRYEDKVRSHQIMIMICF